MAFQPVLNVIEVFTEFAMPSGALVGNRYHILDLQAGIVGARTQECVEVVDAWQRSAAGMNQRSNQVTYVRISGRDLSEQIAPTYEIDVTPPVAGTNASPALASHTTLSVKLSTGLAGRSARGRQYWVGLAEVQVTGDFVVSGVSSAIVTNLNLLRTTLLAEDFQWVIVQRQANGVTLPAGVPRGVTSVTVVDDRVDTQRRRLVGEGN